VELFAMNLRSILILFLFLHVRIPAQVIEKEIFVPAPQFGESRYFYVPFEAPPDSPGLSITYEYDKKGGANVLDLGLFGPDADRVPDIASLKGWSGGRRNIVFVTKDIASNGYLPGSLEPGKWRVILGLYKVVPEGVTVKITVRIDRPEAQAVADAKRESENAIFVPPRKDLPKLAAAAGWTWFRGDLHMHTFHSDGNWTVQGLARFAEAVGLDFVGITDHNTRSHHADVDDVQKNNPRLLIMRGEEVTTYGGHFNVWGLPSGKMIDFRITPGDRAGFSRIASELNSSGLLASVNHPNALCGGCSWTYGDDWSGLEAVEVWNGAWDQTDELALAGWEHNLLAGRRLTAIGSSDSHAPPAGPGDEKNPGIGRPTVYVAARRNSQSEILSSIRAGRVSIGSSPGAFLSMSADHKHVGDTVTVRRGKTILLQIEAGDIPSNAVIKLIQNGAVKQQVPMDGAHWKPLQVIADRDGYVRVEVRDKSNGMIAFTNPIFIKIAK
jgi:hypothetical protein